MGRADTLHLISAERGLPEDLQHFRGVAATVLALANPGISEEESRQIQSRPMHTVAAGAVIKGMKLGAALARETGFGNQAHAEIVGDNTTGITVVMMPSVPLASRITSRRFGFEIKPTQSQSSVTGGAPRDFEVIQGEANKLSCGTTSTETALGQYLCGEVFEGHEVHPASPDVTIELLQSLRERLNRYEDQ